jgi:hypothetical protein
VAFATQQAARDAVRALIADGQPSYASRPFGMVRQESLTDQIPPQATATLTQFYVRFSGIALGRNVTVQAVPSSIAAYRDGRTVPDTVANGLVSSDIDQNGSFTLATAPVSALLVTYGWQLFSDGDLDQLIADASSWLFQWVSGGISTIPDQLNHALALYAGGLACSSIARRMRLPDVSAGEVKEALSQVAKGYEQDAKDFLARADKARVDYWTSADQPKQPGAGVVSVKYPSYQPYR